MKKKAGKVYLVGAGPGDAGLLTVKATHILAKADVVVYDRLISDSVLAKISTKAKRVYVGKKAGEHSVVQDEINKILLTEALQYNIVVRLKGGDPFLFGRGGEELELLVENNIEFEVIPGITSAIAGPAYAGIPVTHRDFCSSLHVITGHAGNNNTLNIDYDALCRMNGTLVFMMSVSSIAQISVGLIDAGMSPNMPCCLVENAARSEQRKFVCSLGNMLETATENRLCSPSVIVVGQVCSLSDKFDFFSNLPLKGIRVLITRPKLVSGKLAKMLTDLGATAKEHPCIDTVPLDWTLDLKNIDWLIFTSAFAVTEFFKKIYDNKLDSRHLYSKKIAVVGPETQTELAYYGIVPDFRPTVYTGEDLASELVASGKVRPNDVLGLFRSKNGYEDIINIFHNNGMIVKDTHLYETVYVMNNIASMENFDFVAFTSASAVYGFVNCYKGSLDGVSAICIGERTAKVAREHGISAITSEEATLSSMAKKLVEVCSGKEITQK